MKKKYKYLLQNLFVALCLVPAPLFGADIVLQKTPLGGMTYSMDGGETFKPLGYGSRKLKNKIATNPGAMVYYRQYSFKFTMAMVTSIVGGGLIGWPLGWTATGVNPWTAQETIMLSSGLVLAITGIILEQSSYKSLQTAVNTYNKGTSNSLNWNFTIDPINQRYAAMVTCNF